MGQHPLTVGISGEVPTFGNRGCVGYVATTTVALMMGNRREPEGHSLQLYEVRSRRSTTAFERSCADLRQRSRMFPEPGCRVRPFDPDAG
jgi:hypothetical protein